MSNSNKMPQASHRYGVVGGLGAIGGADLLSKLIRATQRIPDMPAADIAFEQRHFDEGQAAAEPTYDPTRRKFYVYSVLKSMEARGIDVALLPCFVSHTFLHEVLPELEISVISMFDALRDRIRRDYPDVQTIGVLTSTHVRTSGIFEREFEGIAKIIHPEQGDHSARLMSAVYGPRGIRAGYHGGLCVDQLVDVCAHLADKGADIILPGMTEVSVLIDVLRSRVSVPLIDSNLAYAEYAIGADPEPPLREFKLGVLGGVGPAATVDFMQKVVRLTRASCDQEHIKVVVEQNPQIPDRTANLIGDGEDPTIAMLATCKRLEANGAHAVAIPCNTAHAFVTSIQSQLGIPIVNMLSEVIAFARERMPEVSRLGLLATSGTIASRVYHSTAEAAGMTLLVPDESMQARVMEAIYGAEGVKAGFSAGTCSSHLAAAISHLRDQGAQAVILGCTELPLIELGADARRQLPLLDPTEILAHSCVRLARKERVDVASEGVPA